MRDIRLRDLAAGTYLGSEPEWIARFGIARPAFREAIRLLERDRIVAMRPGRGGGLYVGKPDPAATVASALRHFERMGITGAETIEVARALCPEIAARAAGTPLDRQRLRQVTPLALDEVGNQAGLTILPLLLQILRAYGARQFRTAAAKSSASWTALIDAIAHADGVGAYRAALTLFPAASAAPSARRKRRRETYA
ncbi:MAG: GntR family transcriptional regulator [Steroidobacteraceae bacterium]